MAWMSDEQYELMQDTRDKAITARSARRTRTHCGKGGAVKFPSDYMTKRERDAMNGPIKSYRMNDPMSWEDFKSMEDQFKKDYINAIRNRFGAPDGYIAEMFGIARRTLSLHLMDLKISSGKGNGNSKRKWEKEKFYAWMSGANTNTVEGTAEVVEDDEEIIESVDEQIDIPEIEAPEVTESPVEEVTDAHQDDISECCTVEKKRAIPKTGTMTFSGDIDDILNTISMLLNGANVSLEVQWTVND